MQTVEIKVKMDCDGCERRVRHAVCSIRGNLTLRRGGTSEMGVKQNKVSVTGFVDSAKVLKRVRSTGKKAEMWPYVKHPHDCTIM
ncbi:hypothetical protein MLD38_011387 [Melastoma candidum]|uniref:Uncharacterized protein n=1 Tax=Melastoma candidum TaxID=119954 RepID=A0ACB9R2Y6_9MYRT|nr:hypothetical protein MLD38_011387 [Melastoma candidum]